MFCHGICCSSVNHLAVDGPHLTPLPTIFIPRTQGSLSTNILAAKFSSKPKITFLELIFRGIPFKCIHIVCVSVLLSSKCNRNPARPLQIHKYLISLPGNFVSVRMLTRTTSCMESGQISTFEEKKNILHQQQIISTLLISM